MQFLVLKLDWCTMSSKVYDFFSSCGHLHWPFWSFLNIMFSWSHHHLTSHILTLGGYFCCWKIAILSEQKALKLAFKVPAFFKVYTHSKFAVFSLPQHFQQLNPGMILRLQSASPTKHIFILMRKAKAVPYFDCSIIYLILSRWFSIFQYYFTKLE